MAETTLPVESVDGDRRFEILIDAVTDHAIFMLDPAGCVANWNKGAERIEGYAVSEIVGRHFSIFYTDEDRAAGVPARALEEALARGKCESEGWRVRKDGTRFWAHAVIEAIRSPKGRLLGFAEVTRDASERREAQDTLERTRQALFQSQKMEAVGQLTGGIAHDFNNLLTVISGSLELIQQRPEDRERVLHFAENAQAAAERGARLTQQLLSFARCQSLRPERHGINGLIGSFEAVLRRVCSETVEFDLALDPALLPVLIDAAQLEGSLLNLVMNARDAMAKGGRLTIATANAELDPAAAAEAGVRPGAYVRITVADTGEGMSPETLARAFEPFFTTKPVGLGSGLGLSQVYGFVSQSGGAVSLSSALGQGASVALLLPALAAGAPQPAASGDAAAAPPRSSGTVLVVEDDPDVLRLAVETLRSLDYRVLTAGDGPAALAVLKRAAEIDLLFSDVVMPRGMSGVDLAREAVRLRPALRVVLASGYASSAFAPGCGPENFAFISKPYRGSDLVRMFRSLSA